MNIGQASKQSGITSKMIRYYESIGLINPAKRSASGYRVYDDADIRALKFIQHARALGFSSEQMKELLQLWQNTARQSSEVKLIALKHIQMLEQKIQDMQQMQYLLQSAVEQCADNSESNCHILNQIEQGLIDPQSIR